MTHIPLTATEREALCVCPLDVGVGTSPEDTHTFVCTQHYQLVESIVAARAGTDALVVDDTVTASTEHGILCDRRQFGLGQMLIATAGSVEGATHKAKDVDCRLVEPHPHRLVARQVVCSEWSAVEVAEAIGR